MMAIGGQSPGDGFALRLAVLYGALFAFAGIALPFLPVWLAARGLDAGEIGIVLAASMIARPLIVPVAMRMVDQFGRLRAALVGASWAACATFLAVALSDGFAAILATFTLFALPQSMVLPLADAYALRGLAARERAYGPVRLWGSVTFILANLGGGVLLEQFGAGRVAWALVAALAAAALSAGALAPVALANSADAAPDRADAPAASSPWRSRGFVAVVAATSLIQASHAVLYGFASLQWAGKGLDGGAIGALWAIGVVAEIALFAVSGRITTRVRPMDLIGAGAIGAVLRWTLMALDPPALALPALQCLHGLSFGATHLGAMHFLARFIAVRHSATAQGDYSALIAVASAAQMALAGGLVEGFGSAAYLGMAASALAGAAIIAFARRLDLS